MDSPKGTERSAQDGAAEPLSEEEIEILRRTIAIAASGQHFTFDIKTDTARRLLAEVSGLRAEVARLRGALAEVAATDGPGDMRHAARSALRRT